MDVVFFVADYLEAAKVSDLLGHLSDLPCTVCIIYKKKHGLDSKMGYSVDINSARLAFNRFDERAYLMRKDERFATKERLLGMKEGAEEIYDVFPLSYLSKKLNQVVDRIPLSSQGVPVLSGIFDSYRSNAVAPDHFLSGLAKNILNVCFRSLPSNDLRKKIDFLICSSLEANGIPRERTVYNVPKKKLHKMSMSSVLSTLLFGSHIFRRW